jgi:hypothetical protein
MKENKVGRACGIHERGEKSIQGSGGKAQQFRRPRHKWEDRTRVILGRLAGGGGR